MITLTARAQQQLIVLNAVERGEVRMIEAAALLGLSVRQVRRLRRAYRLRGPGALVHGNCGRPSPRRLDATLRQRVVTLAQTTYAEVNHLHLTELLAEREALTLSRTALRRILSAAGLRSPRRRRPPRHRQRRARMAQAGLLVQLDGSHHAWLQERGPQVVLLAAIDDATGRVLSTVFREREDAQGYLLLLRALALAHGLPVAVYTDQHGIFKRDGRRPPTLQEQLQGGRAPTQVGRALHELGITWIPASSPQAKGRVERLFETLQDRLITEMRLAGIDTLDGAQAFLPDFLERFNTRFAQDPAQPAAAFRPWPTDLDPEAVFCFKYRRTVAADNTVTLGPRRVQILPGPHGRSYARAHVEVHERLDGTLAVLYQSRTLPLHLISPADVQRIPARPHRRVRPRGPGSIQALRNRNRKATGRSGPWTPPATHPWRQPVTARATRQAAQRGRTNSLAR